MNKIFAFSTLTLLSVFVSSGAAGDKTNPAGVEFFEKKIRPVLSEHCYRCHSQEAQKAGKLKAELLLDSRAGCSRGVKVDRFSSRASRPTACS